MAEHDLMIAIDSENIDFRQFKKDVGSYRLNPQEITKQLITLSNHFEFGL